MATDSNVVDKPPVYISTFARDFLQVAILGLVAGLLVKLLSVGLVRYFVEPVFCRGGDFAGICSSADQVALGAANVIVGIVTVVVMVRMNVFRPLLVAVAAIASLWGLTRYMSGIVIAANFAEQTLWFMVLYALVYLLFFWALRLRNFVIALILTILLVVVLRLLLTNL